MAHDTRLLRKETVAERTMAFHFERPEGFHFRAGQRVLLSLLEASEYDGYGIARTFTLASAPHDPELMIVTRMRDTAFKRTLGSAPGSLRLRIEGPSGELTLHREAERPAIFLAGGIGVTPFLSIIRDAIHAGLRHQIRLFYSNRRPEDAPFLGELRMLAAANRGFHFIPTMTDAASSQLPWSGEQGAIGESLLRRHVEGMTRPIYYLAGPPGMVLGMQNLLERTGVAEQDVRDEQFYGYR